MSEGKSKCYFVIQKDGELLKFSYGEQQNIYYQVYSQQCWSEKKCVYKGCFKYYYILSDWKGKIHVFCQDICGDIIQCSLEDTKWNVKKLLQMNITMPRYIRAFIVSDEIHLLYHIVDKLTHAEVLVHQSNKEGGKWSCPEVISRVDNCLEFPYSISQDNANIVLINTIFSKVYQLTSKTFYTAEGKWGKEEIIHTSSFPYRDFALCVKEKSKHFLFIIQDKDINKLIYQYREVGLQRNKTLYQHQKIESCIFVSSKNKLSVLWICENKLYTSESIDHGQNFSHPRVYDNFGKSIPVKVFYQKYEVNKENKCTLPYEIYGIKQNEEDQMYILEKFKDYYDIEVVDQGNLTKLEANIKTDKLQISEKEEVEKKLKDVSEEVRKLSAAIKIEQNERSNLINQLFKEKEKNNLSTCYNNQLIEKISYLEHMLLQKDSERTSIEKELSKMKKKNDELEQQVKQLTILKNENSTNKQMSEKTVYNILNNNSKQPKLSLERWYFKDEKYE